jgi:hypothetical protein
MSLSAEADDHPVLVALSRIPDREPIFHWIQGGLAVARVDLEIRVETPVELIGVSNERFTAAYLTPGRRWLVLVGGMGLTVLDERRMTWTLSTEWPDKLLLHYWPGMLVVSAYGGWPGRYVDTIHDLATGEIAGRLTGDVGGDAWATRITQFLVRLEHERRKPRDP